VAALAAWGALTLRDDSNSPQAAPNQAIRLAGTDSYDPEGDNKEEHDDRVADATDRNPETYWTTEGYRSEFTKSGVGLVLDAQREVSPKELVVTTDTPGFEAEIRAGASPLGRFDPVSGSKTVEEATTFPINDGTKARFFMVWITALDGSAHVNEVRAR
jgi:hypothetical protein